MSRVCQVTGKKPMKGNLVSHANNKTKRVFQPNLHYRRFWVESQNRWVRLRVSTTGLRKIDKLGVEAVLAEIHAKAKALNKQKEAADSRRTKEKARSRGPFSLRRPARRSCAVAARNPPAARCRSPRRD